MNFALASLAIGTPAAIVAGACFLQALRAGAAKGVWVMAGWAALGELARLRRRDVLGERGHAVENALRSAIVPMNRPSWRRRTAS